MNRPDGVQLSLFRYPPLEDGEIPRHDSGAEGSENEGPGLLGRSIWTAREMAAWAPPEDLRVSEWAEQHRMLPLRQSASPGPWTNVPYYTVEVMDAFTDPHVERITIMASVQSSKTESAYNMLGYAICQDPAPALMVMPTLTTLRRINKRIETMIKESPEMAKHLTGDPDDITRQEIRLDNMSIYFATAGSSTDLRNVEARYLFLDEMDDYQAGAGDQGSPIEMAEARTTTYWNRKIAGSCTPTFEDGYVNVEYERSDQSEYWVPCPFCRGYQVLRFRQIKHKGEMLGQWPKGLRDPEYIRVHRVARYECEYCGKEIDDRDKRWMLRFGTWVPSGHFIGQDGTVPIPRPRAGHRGFWWNALYSPWRTFSDVAAQFFATKDDTEKHKTFINLWLAEPWKQVILKSSEAEILKSRCELPPQTVPQEAIALTCFVDCQKYSFWFAVRAWARDYTSWLIHYGQVSTWSDVEKLLFETEYPIHELEGQTMRIWRAAVDTGGGDTDSSITMTEEAYWWIRKHGIGRGCRVWGTKGASSPLSGKLHIGKPLDKTPSGKPIPGGLQIIQLDTRKLKDAFHYRLEQARERMPQAAYLHSGTDRLYASHILAEEKRRNKKGIEEWVQVRRRNDLLDCECGNIALADPEWPGGGIGILALYDDAQKREETRKETPDNREKRRRW